MKKVWLLSLLSMISCPCWSQPLALSLEQKREKMDSMISAWDRYGIFNGSVLVLQKGNVIYQRSAGYANFETRFPNTDTTLFNLASVSKPFTAIAVLQLVGKKKLQLQDPLARYFPDFPYPAVTVIQLLSHTSGLPEADQYEKSYITARPSEILSNQKIYDDLVKLKAPTLAPAGEKHFYNNLNYILLAMLVERISKTPFAAYMRQNIFQRAGMQHTYVRERISPNTARYFQPAFYDTTFYHVDSITNRKIYTDYHLGGTYGDNNVVTSMQDMVLFDKALRNGKLLPKELAEQMYQPVKLANGTYFSTGGKKTYTLGWNVNEKNFRGQFAVWHDGSLVGLTTILFRNMTDDITYIMYENRNVPNFFRRFLAITDVVDGGKLTAVPLQRSLVREYGVALTQKGMDAAAVLFNKLKSDTGWYFYEHEMNALGYQLLLKSDFKHRKELALEVFKINTLLFPQSANAYDSYAEALMESGLVNEAVSMYQKSIYLDPKNEKAKEQMRRLSKSPN